MAYTDVMLAPQASYSYVNNKQFYDTIVTLLTANSNWQFVESVDAVSAPNTHRRFVWKCKAAGSGLPADFYVVFSCPFTTAGGLYHTSSPMTVFLGEGYSGGVLSKYATNSGTITIAADRTNPATWNLTVATVPQDIIGGGQYPVMYIGPQSNLTSTRYWVAIAKDAIMSTWTTQQGSNATVQASLLYAGAYDSFLTAAEDPMPLVLSANGYSNPYWWHGGCTRVPLLTPSTAYVDAFQIIHYRLPTQNTGPWAANSYLTPVTGTLGNAADLSWPISYGSPTASKICIASWANNPALTNSQRGLSRGTFKYVVGATCVTHSYGDTFMVDGKIHASVQGGTSGSVLVNTEAA